ncbi:sensor domain-containing diguanylate cyclase [Humidesulfovibrio mexicanus]|nr:sensor domain-containing diguanylate cyclase [Humidesulfovibrio mexicanus]
MMASPRSYSLVRRLRAMLWAMLLLPVAAGIGFFTVHSSRALQREALDDLTAILRLQQQFVEHWTLERSADIGLLASDPRILTLPEPRLRAMFRTVLDESPAFNIIVYVDQDGRTRGDPKGPSGVDVSDRDYFKAARDGREFVSDVITSRLTGKREFIVSSPVRDGQGRFRGLIMGGVSTEALSTLMRTVQDETSGNAVLLRASGELLAPLDADGGLKPGDVLLDRATAREPSSGVYRNAQGERVVGTYLWCLDGRWLLAAERLETDVIRVHAGVLAVPLAGAALVFLVFGPALLRLARSLDAPLKQLEEHARQIEQGNFEVACPPLPVADAPEEVLRLDQAYRLMVARVRSALDALREASLTDALTGVGNRKRLFSEGPRLLDASLRGGRPTSVLMLDLDHFKLVNDAHGHAAGDAVLAAFAGLLRGLLRQSDLFARYGGEEFAVLAPNAGARQAVELAERIRQAVERLEVPVNGETLRFTVSIGAASLEPPATVHAQGAVAILEALLGRADEALYAAKATGRNRVECRSMASGSAPVL